MGLFIKIEYGEEREDEENENDDNEWTRPVTTSQIQNKTQNLPNCRTSPDVM